MSSLKDAAAVLQVTRGNVHEATKQIPTCPSPPTCPTSKCGRTSPRQPSVRKPRIAGRSNIAVVHHIAETAARVRGSEAGRASTKHRFSYSSR